MNTSAQNLVESAEIILPCSDFDESLKFFTEFLGFQIFSIFPADNPAVAVIYGYGTRLRLEKITANTASNKFIELRLNCTSPEKVADGKLELTAPNGVKIKLVDANPSLIIPDLRSSFVLTKISDDASWVTGRAGMRYRDLIPDRQGGRFIASHIHIPVGGKVPDYVHYHKIQFQIIFCYKGWAKLVYEDQGEPFIFEAGDCVLQPPQIRHRVLESSDNLEVIEFSCPAEHETFADNEMDLPTPNLNSKRDFNGQFFVHHKSIEAVWKKWRVENFECRDTGIGTATNGLASVKVVRPNSLPVDHLYQHNAELVFIFILHGKVNFSREISENDTLKPGDSLVIPTNLSYSFSNYSDDLEFLEITMPETFETKFS